MTTVPTSLQTGGSSTTKTKTSTSAGVGSVHAQVAANLSGAAATTSQSSSTSQVSQSTATVAGAQYSRDQARDIAAGILSSYAFNKTQISELSNWIESKLNDGIDPATIVYMLPGTDAYKQRFPANEYLMKHGGDPLAPSDYIALERAYKQTARAYGLPKGFYDQQSDFTDLIEKGVSAEEFSQRAQAVASVIDSSPKDTLTTLQKYYGIDKGHIYAWALDPNKALPIIQKQIAAGEIGAEAMQQGLSVDRKYAETLYGDGISNAQAQQAFNQVAQTKDNLTKLAKVSDTSALSTQQLASGALGLDAKSQNKVAKLQDQESSRFGGANSGINLFGRSGSGAF